MEKSFIVQLAKQSLEIEAQALSKLKSFIGNEFVDCIQTIHSSQGRVIVTGIGKSALIGKKIAATFNSTGTSSFFMHAADALHGDIGMIKESDILMVLSKSGETPEFKALLPIVENMGNTIISLCSNENSFLAKHSNIFLHTPVDEESDPNKLAPTTSSLVQLAMGDAIAVCLLSSRGFTKEEFARFHPAGSLGKQMYLKVSDLSKNNDKPGISKTDSIKSAILEMTSKRLGAVVVLDHDQSILGIITDGDIRRMLEKYDDFSGLTPADIMCEKPKMIDGAQLAVNALSIMRKNSITQLIVTVAGEYTGIVHIHDILREGII